METRSPRGVDGGVVGALGAAALVALVVFLYFTIVLNDLLGDP